MNKQVFGALLLLVAAAGTFIYVLDHIRVIDARALAAPTLKRIPYVREWLFPPAIPADELAREEMANQRAGLQAQDGELDETAQTLSARAAELAQLEQSVKAAQAQVQLQQDEIRQQQEQLQSDEQRYKKLAELLGNMQPQAAARILAATDTVTDEPLVEDETVIAVLLRMENSAAAIIMQFMPAERASALVRKLGR